jgi:23S rRNA pseudouridine1911/1915/1917 synthase
MTQNHFEFIANDDDVKARLDKCLAQHCEGLSRARVQALIADGQCRVNARLEDSGSYRVKLNDRIELSVPDPVASEIQPEDIDLDIIFEDEDVIVLNKPAGLVVHPGAGNWSGTLVNALLFRFKGQLSGIGGVERPGIVHRLDKDTSGLMMVAKTDRAHKSLSGQLADRTLSRVYHALVMKVPTPLKGAVNIPIGRHQQQRIKMSIFAPGASAAGLRQAKEAKTHYHVIKNIRDALSLVECRLETGRTHQIRVHMAHLRHPLVGDPLYGPQQNALFATVQRAGFYEDVVRQIMEFPRQALHAKKISFEHPVSGEVMHFEAEYPEDFKAIMHSILS